MGVVTGTLFKGLNFGGIDSRNYGVYITGEAVYNAPVRDVEMINVPGRNGAYALDRGRFENITVTYPAGMMEGTAADFAANISDFRNALAALTGYQRLTDDYNPAEYRQAVYTGGLEVEAATGHNAGEFEIVFTCKPQRFLTAGEQAVTVTSGDELDNPTLFSSRPLLMVWGAGNIIMGDNGITVDNVPVGGITLAPYGEKYETVPAHDTTTTQTAARRTVIIDNALMNTGDTITVSSMGFNFMPRYIGQPAVVIESANYEITQESFSRASASVIVTLGGGVNFTYLANAFTFTVGTSATRRLTGRVTATDSSSNTYSLNFDVYVSYNGSDKIQEYVTTRVPPYWAIDVSQNNGAISGYSTRTPEGSAVFIDLDIGEAYFHVDGSPVSADNLVSFDNYELPELDPGTNVITFDNTVTQLQVVPRWWKV